MTHLDADVDESEEPAVDAYAAEKIARERLALALTPKESGGIRHESDVATLDENCWRIRRKLLEGETLDSMLFTEAFTALDRLRETLEDVEALIAQDPWDRNARWGELTEEQRAEARKVLGTDPDQFHDGGSDQ